MNMMDSLELPCDMFWTGKTEPPSPDRSLSSKSSFNNDLIVGNADEFWPIEDNLLSNFAIDEESTAGQIDIKNRPEELLNELIEFKEEGQWFNQENVDLSVFTSMAEASFVAPEATVTPMAFPSPPPPPPAHPLGSIYPVAAGHQQPLINKVEGNSYVAATDLLFNAINNICSEFEASYQHLTPPQSPPQPPTYYGQHHQQHLHQPQLADAKVQIVYEAPLPMTSAASANLFHCEERSFVDLQLQSSECLDKTFVGDSSSNSPQDPDLMALEFIDELLRHNGHANKAQEEISASYDSFQQIPTTDEVAMTEMLDEEDYSDESSTQFSTPSCGNSLASSPSRSGSPMDDDDWMPRSATEKKSSRSSSSSIKSLSSSSKRRPYARGGEVTEKKNRKKEQNKNAATRYRQKKKQEIEEILAEEAKLRKVHKKLQTQFSDARREVKYLKNLLRDMYKQNNIII